MNQLPKRIQRKRVKGWRMPANTVYVGRPTDWGNQFVVGFGCDPFIVASHWLARHKFEQWIEKEKQLYPNWFAEWLAPLRGKNLACWCPLDQPCHADVLLKLANEEK
jgi:hypothetical protein